MCLVIFRQLRQTACPNERRLRRHTRLFETISICPFASHSARELNILRGPRTSFILVVTTVWTCYCLLLSSDTNLRTKTFSEKTEDVNWENKRETRTIESAYEQRIWETHVGRRWERLSSLVKIVLFIIEQLNK